MAKQLGAFQAAVAELSAVSSDGAVLPLQKFPTMGAFIE
jgi:hypothetical protein